MPHHPLRQLALGGARGGGDCHQFARAQHGNAVRNAQHFAEFVADENDRQALCHHLPEHGKQRQRFGRGQHSRGLVKNQNARTPEECFQNLDPLALTHRQAAHQGIGLHRQAKPLGRGQQALARLGAAGEGLPQRLCAHHDVVQHAQVISQREVLVHHANACIQSGPGVAGSQRFAKHLNAADISRVVPEQDGH